MLMHCCGYKYQPGNTVIRTLAFMKHWETREAGRETVGALARPGAWMSPLARECTNWRVILSEDSILMNRTGCVKAETTDGTVTEASRPLLHKVSDPSQPSTEFGTRVNLVQNWAGIIY